MTTPNPVGCWLESDGVGWIQLGISWYPLISRVLNLFSFRALAYTVPRFWG